MVLALDGEPIGRKMCGGGRERWNKQRKELQWNTPLGRSKNDVLIGHRLFEIVGEVVQAPEVH